MKPFFQALIVEISLPLLAPLTYLDKTRFSDINSTDCIRTAFFSNQGEVRYFPHLFTSSLLLLEYNFFGYSFFVEKNNILRHLFANLNHTNFFLGPRLDFSL